MSSGIPNLLKKEMNIFFNKFGELCPKSRAVPAAHKKTADVALHQRPPQAAQA
jgi:hypothetical protein